MHYVQQILLYRICHTVHQSKWLKYTNFSLHVHFKPVITRWSGSTSRMRVICEARNANLLSRTRLIAVSVVYWWVGNLYDVCIGLTELGGLSQSPCKME